MASVSYWNGTFYFGDGLYRSTDGGDVWQQVLPTITGDTEVYAVADIDLASDNRLYVGTMQNLENKGGGIVLTSADIAWGKI